MKKIALLVGFIVVALSAAAQYTATSRITLSTSGQADMEVMFVMAPSYSDAIEPGDVTAVNVGGIYVYAGGERYTMWVSKEYSKNLHLGFATVGHSSFEPTRTYTLKFSNFYGTPYEIRDLVSGNTIEVKDNLTPDYVFTITSLSNQSINDRFVINYEEDVDEGELEICFNENGDNKLVIKNNPYSGKIAVKDANGDDVTGSPFDRAATKPSPQEIDLSGLAAGKYTVEIGGKHLIIIR